MAMLKVNGRAIPAPAAMKVTLLGGAEIGRNAAGNAVLDRMSEKRRLELNWAHMDADALSILLNEMQGFFEAEYPDPASGMQRSMSCYCSDRVAGILRMADDKPVWTDVKMSWTER